ncbi:unnamed protein product, partial [Ectocarpus sp. 8 AP-2014]
MPDAAPCPLFHQRSWNSTIDLVGKVLTTFCTNGVTIGWIAPRLYTAASAAYYHIKANTTIKGAVSHLYTREVSTLDTEKQNRAEVTVATPRTISTPRVIPRAPPLHPTPCDSLAEEKVHFTPTP